RPRDPGAARLESALPIGGLQRHRPRLLHPEEQGGGARQCAVDRLDRTNAQGAFRYLIEAVDSMPPAAVSGNRGSNCRRRGAGGRSSPSSPDGWRADAAAPISVMNSRRFTAGPFRAFDRKVSTPQLRQETAALRDFDRAYVRFGSKADKASCLDFVRFAPESGHSIDALGRLTPANRHGSARLKDPGGRRGRRQ